MLVLLTAVPCDVSVPLAGSANAVAPSFRKNSSQVFVDGRYVTLKLKYSVPKSVSPVVFDVMMLVSVPCRPLLYRVRRTGSVAVPPPKTTAYPLPELLSVSDVPAKIKATP